MKYAKEVGGLLSAYPGRQFTVAQIVGYIATGAHTESGAAISRGVLRVLSVLERGGYINVVRKPTNGAKFFYSWKQ